jgi:hypothetical protein
MSKGVSGWKTISTSRWRGVVGQLMRSCKHRFKIAVPSWFEDQQNVARHFSLSIRSTYRKRIYACTGGTERVEDQSNEIHSLQLSLSLIKSDQTDDDRTIFEEGNKSPHIKKSNLHPDFSNWLARALIFNIGRLLYQLAFNMLMMRRKPLGLFCNFLKGEVPSFPKKIV